MPSFGLVSHRFCIYLFRQSVRQVAKARGLLGQAGGLTLLVLIDVCGTHHGFPVVYLVYSYDCLLLP